MKEKENGGVGQGPKEVVELDGSGFFVGLVEEVVDPGYHFVLARVGMFDMLESFGLVLVEA